MVIYVDILIVLNLFVNYFIILATVKILRKKVILLRIVIGSLIGAIASLYIFLPESTLFNEIIFKILICTLIGISVFELKSLKQFLKSVGVLFLVTCTYAGVMIAVWKIFKPSGMAINNSVVYFSISPLSIVLFSVLFYLLFSITFKFFARNNIYAIECEITIFYKERKIEFNAIVDTGNSVSDVFGKSEIIIVDNSVFECLFIKSDEECQTRYRAIPYSSVSGNGILDGYRCDSCIIKSSNKILNLKSPIIAVSKTPIINDYLGLVNPQIFE